MFVLSINSNMHIFSTLEAAEKWCSVNDMRSHTTGMDRSYLRYIMRGENCVGYIWKAEVHN